MFTLHLYDRNGAELKLGDIVRISNGKEFDFYAEVTYLEAEQAIAPFHTFSFHSLEKVDAVPEHATQCYEDRYRIWSTYTAEPDTNANASAHYLTEWRAVEHLLDRRIYRITTQP